MTEHRPDDPQKSAARGHIGPHRPGMWPPHSEHPIESWKCKILNKIREVWYAIVKCKKKSHNYCPLTPGQTMPSSSQSGTAILA